MADFEVELFGSPGFFVAHILVVTFTIPGIISNVLLNVALYKTALLHPNFKYLIANVTGLATFMALYYTIKHGYYLVLLSMGAEFVDIHIGTCVKTENLIQYAKMATYLNMLAIPLERMYATKKLDEYQKVPGYFGIIASVIIDLFYVSLNLRPRKSRFQSNNDTLQYCQFASRAPLHVAVIIGMCSAGYMLITFGTTLLVIFKNKNVRATYLSGKVPGLTVAGRVQIERNTLATKMIIPSLFALCIAIVLTSLGLHILALQTNMAKSTIVLLMLYLGHIPFCFYSISHPILCIMFYPPFKAQCLEMFSPLRRLLMTANSNTETDLEQPQGQALGVAYMGNVLARESMLDRDNYRSRMLHSMWGTIDPKYREAETTESETTTTPQVRKLETEPATFQKLPSTETDKANN